MDDSFDIFADDPLVIVKLGAGGDSYKFVPPAIRPHTILVCLDAANAPQHAGEGFRKVVQLRDVVAESTEPRQFIEREWWACSSLLEADGDLVRKYGLSEYYTEKARTVVRPSTLPDLLLANGLQSFDLLITDLEGSDFPVLKSCGKKIESATIVQSELRFEPLYEGEPQFHEVAAYMADHGFRLVEMHEERWKPASRNKSSVADGVLVWADCVFYRAGEVNPRQIAKSVVLLSMMGLRGLAAHILETHASVLSAALRAQLESLTKPYGRAYRLRKKFRSMASSIKRRVYRSRFNFDHLVQE